MHVEWTHTPHRYTCHFVDILINFVFLLWQDLGGTPWKAMLTSAPLWALIIGEIGHDWGLYTMITDLPKYMGDVMHFNIAEVSTAEHYIEIVYVLISSDQ